MDHPQSVVFFAPVKKKNPLVGTLDVIHVNTAAVWACQSTAYGKVADTTIVCVWSKSCWCVLRSANVVLFYSCHELQPWMYYLLYVLCQCADFPQWSPMVLQTKIYAPRSEFFHL